MGIEPTLSAWEAAAVLNENKHLGRFHLTQPMRRASFFRGVEKPR